MFFRNNDKFLCSGCGVCKNICPRNAIMMEDDEKGFSYPVIKEERCINCGLCEKVCPMVNEKFSNSPLKIYACKNKNENIRKTSSSGGVFEEISNIILEQNGVIFGAGFSEDNKVKHMKAENIEELQELKKSKYVQSDVKNIYNQVKNEIVNERKILFSGTPCQVQALRNNVSINKENIFLLDVVCHGVPSPKIFEDYKQYLEKQYNSKIVKINFRHKDEESTQNIKVDFENGKTYISNKAKGDPYYRLFLKDINLRESCFKCNFKAFERGGDISLADFWGYELGKAKDFGDNKGISLVLINTTKGLEMFEKIKDKLEFLEVSKEECEPYNCFSNFNPPDEYESAWKDYIEKGFEEMIKYVN